MGDLGNDGGLEIYHFQIQSILCKWLHWSFLKIKKYNSVVGEEINLNRSNSFQHYFYMLMNFLDFSFFLIRIYKFL